MNLPENSYQHAPPPPVHTNILRSTSRASGRSGRSASAHSATSGRSRTSTLSRNASLIKKNIDLHDLRPADVLIERFVAWKVIVKQLCSYFEGIADIENNTAREMTKLATVIQVPFRSGNQFLGEGGLQDIYYTIRDKTRVIADQHADLGRTIDSSIVQHLQRLTTEIKAHIKNVQNDTGKLAASVAKEREQSTRLVGELANGISTFKNTPMNLQAKSDPYIVNQAVSRQLTRQVLEENLLQKSIVMMQQNSAHFEGGIVRAIQSAWATFDEWQSRASAASQAVYRQVAAHMSNLDPETEWIQFTARTECLLDPETPLRSAESVRWPLMDEPCVQPLHVGHLERKKRFTRNWASAYFVLTPAGFLHEFASSDPKVQASTQPTFSLFLPNCTLGPPSPPKSPSHKFHIEGRKDGLGTSGKTGSLKGLFSTPLGGSSRSTSLGGGGDAKAFSFRARSHEELMEWWNDIRMLCARYLVASDVVDRKGPVEQAVRSVGYTEEEMEEEEEEFEELEVAEERVGLVVGGQIDHDHEGSSVEEERDVEVVDNEEVRGRSRYQELPPDYTGNGGYMVDKKGPMPGSYAHGPPPTTHPFPHAPSTDQADTDDLSLLEERVRRKLAQQQHVEGYDVGDGNHQHLQREKSAYSAQSRQSVGVDHGVEGSEQDHEGSVRGGGGEQGVGGAYLGPKAPASLTSERAKATRKPTVTSVTDEEDDDEGMYEAPAVTIPAEQLKGRTNGAAVVGVDEKREKMAVAPKVNGGVAAESDKDEQAEDEVVKEKVDEKKGGGGLFASIGHAIRG